MNKIKKEFGGYILLASDPEGWLAYWKKTPFLGESIYDDIDMSDADIISIEKTLRKAIHELYLKLKNNAN